MIVAPLQPETAVLDRLAVRLGAGEGRAQVERRRDPTLASRVLGLCLRRLRADWQARWGHPVLVVESFVDESQYRGTCYRACGFEDVGATAGVEIGRAACRGRG